MITVPIHEGEARVRGQLAYDNPDVAMVYVFYTIGNECREYIMSGGNLRGSISCPEEI